MSTDADTAMGIKIKIKKATEILFPSTILFLNELKFNLSAADEDNIQKQIEKIITNFVFGDDVSIQGEIISRDFPPYIKQEILLNVARVDRGFTEIETWFSLVHRFDTEFLYYPFGWDFDQKRNTTEYPLEGVGEIVMTPVMNDENLKIPQHFIVHTTRKSIKLGDD